MAGKRTYHSLDGLRGIAALAVLLLHFEVLLAPLLPGRVALVPNGYLAVDLFFVLSGFVLEHSYGERFRMGLGALAFMKMRYVRLYPLYILGTAIGLVSAVVAWRLGAGELDLFGIGFAALAALFILPSPTWWRNGLVFVLNSPGWSLFFELFANMMFVMIWFRLSNRALWVMLLGSGVILTAIVLSVGHADLGSSWTLFAGGFPRVIYSFFAGVLVYRVHFRLADKNIPGWLLLLLVPLLFFVPVATGWRPYFDIVCIVLVFPPMILIGTCGEPGPRGAAIFRNLGLISYPLYAVHVPLLELERRALRMLHVDIEGHRIILAVGSALVLTTGSWVLARYYDEPVRRVLNRRASIR